jgi:hypothetical protein
MLVHNIITTTMVLHLLLPNTRIILRWSGITLISKVSSWDLNLRLASMRAIEILRLLGGCSSAELFLRISSPGLFSRMALEG